MEKASVFLTTVAISLTVAAAGLLLDAATLIVIGVALFVTAAILRVLHWKRTGMPTHFKLTNVKANGCVEFFRADEYASLDIQGADVEAEKFINAGKAGHTKLRQVKFRGPPKNR